MLFQQYMLMSALCCCQQIFTHAFAEPNEGGKKTHTRVKFLLTITPTSMPLRANIIAVSPYSKTKQFKLNFHEKGGSSDDALKSMFVTWKRPKQNRIKVTARKEAIQFLVSKIPHKNYREKRRKRQIIDLEKNKKTESPVLPKQIQGSTEPELFTSPPDRLRLSIFNPYQEQEDSPKVVLQVNTIIADVDVGFQKYLSPDIFEDRVDGNAHSLDIELLTVDGKPLFDTSWIKFDQSSLKLLGFPLKGNQDEHIFFLKATNSRKKFALQKIKVIVLAISPVFNHYLCLCTTMLQSAYAGSVKTRLKIAKSFAIFILPGSRTNDVSIWKFQNGCMFVTFKHLPEKGGCDFKAIETIEKNAANDGNGVQFQHALKQITHILSLNLTVLNECKKPDKPNDDDGLGWLRDTAPIFILIAVVAIPTLISCIVSREVRRRQALMKQIQDKRMKEDREQMLLQAAEYKHECGFDSENDNEEQVVSFRPSRHQEVEEKRFFGFSRLADIIIPEVVIDKVKQGTEILNTFIPQEAYEAAANEAIETAQRRLSVVQTLHPRHRLLDMSLEEAAKEQTAPKATYSRFDKVVKFLKNPLEIDVSQEQDKQENSRTNNNHKNDGKKQKYSRFKEVDSNEDEKHYEGTKQVSKSIRGPAYTILPNFSTILKVNEMQRTHGPFKAFNDSVNSTMRNKLALVLDAKADSRNPDVMLWNENSYQFGIGNEDDARKHPAKSQKRKAKSVSCIENPYRCDSEKTGGFLNRIVSQSRQMIGIERLGQWVDKNEKHFSACDIANVNLANQNTTACKKDAIGFKFRNEFATSSVKKCKHLSNKSVSSRLARPCNDKRRENRMWDANYEISNNLRGLDLHTALLNRAQNPRKSLYEGFAERSDFSKSTLDSREMLHVRDCCFVNMVTEQLGDQLVTNETVDKCLKEFPRHSWTRNTSQEDVINTAVRESYEIPKNKNKLMSCVTYRAEKSTVEGLKHFDPESGSWHPDNRSKTKTISDKEMFSLLDHFKKTEGDVTIRKTSIRNDNAGQSNLEWRWLNCDTEEQRINSSKDEMVRKSRVYTNSDFTDAGNTFGYQNTTSDTLYDRQKTMEYHQRNFKKYWSTEHKIQPREREDWKQEQRGIWTEEPPNMDGDDDFYESIEEDQGEYQRMYDEGLLGDRYEHHSDQNNAQQILYSHQYANVNEIMTKQDLEEKYTRDRSYDLYYKTQTEQLMPDSHGRKLGFQDGHELQNSYQNNNTFDSNNPNDQIFSQLNNNWEIEAETKKQDNLKNGNGNNKIIDLNVKDAEIAKAGKNSLNSNGATKENYKAPEQIKNGNGISEESYQVPENPPQGRRRSMTDSELIFSSPRQKSQVSPTWSEPDYTTRNNDTETRKERRRSFLERQRRVEIPERQTEQNQPTATPKININPLCIGQHKKDNSAERFDFDTVNRMQKARENATMRTRKLTYSDPFSMAQLQSERIHQQDADIIEHQTLSNLEKRRQSLQHVMIPGQQCNVTAEKEQVAMQYIAKRDEPFKRVGMRRFSTPSMESWTSTPEKYYYDACGDNYISEENLDCVSRQKEKDKGSFSIGRGRAKEYTQRFLKGVSPKIRRHSTCVMGRSNNQSSVADSPISNTTTFLGKIGEQKFVQTIQTKLGKKESRNEEVKSPISKEKEKLIEEERAAKGSPLTKIKNTFYLLSGGK